MITWRSDQLQTNITVESLHYSLQLKKILHWPVVIPDFLPIQEVLLVDSDVMSGELLWMVLDDGNNGVAHL